MMLAYIRHGISLSFWVGSVLDGLVAACVCVLLYMTTKMEQTLITERV